MTYKAVTDAWVLDMQTNVPELASAIVHLYASWSVEQLQAGASERHLAVWPEGEAEVAEGMTTDASLLATQSYVVMVWEDASAESARRFDDVDANAAWLKLAEDVRARFLVTANVRLGDSNIMRTQYLGTAFDLVGSVRMMALKFAVRIPLFAAA